MVSLLDIIGPVMVGPSSSHTAGACRIGLFARGMLGATPDKALVELHGSFARTGVGHGTDRAIAGGLLGYLPDDERLRGAVDDAAKAGMELTFENTKLRGEHHPNTTRITLTKGPVKVTVIGSSLGAGRVAITEIDGYPVEITGSFPVLVIVAKDQPGIIAAISGALAAEETNISTMRVSRRQKGGDAIHIYELDAPASPSAVEHVRALPAVKHVRAVDRVS
ncbi:MAG TPA: L-serine ammonia-lyase, iron-sulfur-dependent subunit beta [Gemmatimonadales bacterium]|nr:L-serine ammonia-lyase, iron-sulfur-dependent subunit beta [Gemmatimonadales bacterium]